MASASTTSPDTLVTIKVNIAGNNKRFKLPLRDLGATTLPGKLRNLLEIPLTSDVTFDRYSDSAAAFINLDPSNAQVYKQLYRAAKAKLKLRLRATVTTRDPVVPKPATVEDEEDLSLAEEEMTPVSQRQPSPSPEAEPAQQPSTSAVTEPTDFPSVSELQREFEQLLVDHSRYGSNTGACPVLSSTPIVPKAMESASVAPPPPGPVPTAEASSSSVPVTRGSAERAKWFADLANVSHERQNAIRNKTGAPAPPVTSVFSVYCNHCTRAIPNEHYHCSTCDDGDYDLCPTCVDSGVLCSGEDHWLIKRFVRNGRVINSTTETIPPKLVPIEQEESATAQLDEQEEEDLISTRTCNSCIQEWSEEKFVTCTTCEDYDLCIPCHTALKHGHDPKHAFTPAVKGTELDVVAQLLLAPGRNASHHAICDGCDKYIYGVRHKCVICPDWDYCSECVVNAHFVHPLHKFIPLYEHTPNVHGESFVSTARHCGIYCDGPLCNATNGGNQTYIKGDRYKCAVCHDTDFCANCEASPSNPHNKTHPLIKFKTAIRNVSVTTMGDRDDGKPMPVMGDRRSQPISKATETTSTLSTNAATQVQTVADLEPTECKTEETPQAVEEAKELPAAPSGKELIAHFVRDTVADGSVIAPNTVFEQTWYLRNGGTESWPAGCTVKFIGGDNMCAVDPQHPAPIHELISAGESTTCYTEVAPGQEAGFTVLMRTLSTPGTCISYWRLTSPSGFKFGHRLWCDVRVEDPSAAEKEEPEVAEELTVEAEGSQMIFPKLEKESPASSIHAQPQVESDTTADDFDELVDEPLDEEETEDGFLTDEEYDILDASDEEYLADQEKAAKK